MPTEEANTPRATEVVLVLRSPSVPPLYLLTPTTRNDSRPYTIIKKRPQRWERIIPHTTQAASITGTATRADDTTPPGLLNSTSSSNTDALELILQLLQRIDLSKVVPVLQKVINAISGKTTLPEIISALMSCFYDITNLLSTNR